MPLENIANEYIDYLWEGEQLLLETLNMALDHSEFELEKIELLNECVSPEKLVSEAVRLVRPLAYRKAIELQLSFLSEIPENVLTDPIRLRQILINLLNNAIKYTDSGRVILEVFYEGIHADSGILQFAVSDTGPGLPMAEIPRLMRAFQRNSTSAQGSGLGLFIAARLINIFGGELQADSTEICNDYSGHDHGTCFSFRIPVQVSDPDTGTTCVNGKEMVFTQCQPESVLIADDDRLARKVHRRMIEHMFPSCSILEASDGIDAVSLWHQHHPDIIFMDLSMKMMGGLEAAQTIRRLETSNVDYESRKECLLIALTGKEAANLLQECRKSGFNHVLQKPVILTDILGFLSDYAR